MMFFQSKKFTPLFLPLVLVLTSAFILSVVVNHHLCDGFSKRHIYSNRSEFQESSKADTTILPILSQKYFYKEKGSQFYVFESEDGQYVLKFFRFERYKKKKQILENLLKSCELAFNELYKETNLIHLHLKKTNELCKVTCYDKLKRPFLIDLDQVEFILQKKGERLYPYLTSLIESNKKEEVKLALIDLVGILRARMNKGIFDDDSSLSKNAGFCSGKAMLLDIGQFSRETKYQNPEAANLEIKKITADLVTWLSKKDRELALFLDQLPLEKSL